MTLVWIIGATAWWTTALVHKDGPWDIFLKFRLWSFKVWGQKWDEELQEYKAKSPLVCTFCTGPWVLVPIIGVNYVFPYIIMFFGILGLAAAVRGMSNEY